MSFCVSNQCLTDLPDSRNSISNCFNKLQGCGEPRRTAPMAAPPLGGFAPAGSSGASRLRPRLRRSRPASPRASPSAYGLHPSMGPQRGLSRSPNRAGGYRPPCPALRASLFDPPGRGFAPPHRFAAVPLPSSRYPEEKGNFWAFGITAWPSWGASLTTEPRLMETGPAARPPGAFVHRMPGLRAGQGRAVFSLWRFEVLQSQGGTGFGSLHRPRRSDLAASSASR